MTTGTVLSRLDGESVARWATAGRDALEAARQEIDDLNVYPVPDGDTGTNLYLTVAAAVESLAEAALRDDTETPTPSRLMSALAQGALLGARGNSGVILAQLLRGIADGLRGIDGQVDATMLARALGSGRARRTPRWPTRSRAPCSPLRGSLPRSRPPSPRHSTTPTRWRPWSPRRPAVPAPRWPARPTSSRCCAGRGSSTPAAAGSACCSTRWPRS